jgi:hypothetical protein
MAKSLNDVKESQVSITLVSDNWKDGQKILVTPSLAGLIALAADINRSYGDKYNLSFSSLAIAMLAVDNPFSNYFAAYVKQKGIELRLLQRRKFKSVDELKVKVVDYPSTLNNALSIRPSAQSLFEGALNFSNKQPLDIHHLMAAYIYSPGDHEKDLIALGFIRSEWSNSFLEWVRLLHPDELEGWENIHREVFPDVEPEPISSIEQKLDHVKEFQGPSPHITRDIWTATDTLGYKYYAFAIYRFLTHKETQAPLTISIQAPWGGGKTSLMRMIQQYLDPESPSLKKDSQQDTDNFGSRWKKWLPVSIQKWFRPDFLTVRAFQRELKDAAFQKEGPPVPKISESAIALDSKHHRLTIWFNAWKYESTNQVWAGLVDAILQQVALRLEPLEREKFWLCLNFKRLNVDKIRQDIHDRIVALWRPKIWMIVSAILGGAISWIPKVKLQLLELAPFGQPWLVIGISGIGATVGAFISYAKTFFKVKEEPASWTLRDYLDIPDYRKELGFIHHMEMDLRRGLAAVPDKFKPLVVFIDDLDRCSPSKVAQVLEGVNLFLAGEFPDCIFVMGMDTEMVAAALHITHKDMISIIPEDSGIPLGWRFMDKFVQLPILIPPPEKGDLLKYTNSLFPPIQQAKSDPDYVALIKEFNSQLEQKAKGSDPTQKNADDVIDDLKNKGMLKRSQEARLREDSDKIIEVANFKRLDEDTKNFYDDPAILEKIKDAKGYFSDTPRELKRFINTFRFNYFIWCAHKVQGKYKPALEEQLVRWTVLSMHWPDVVRWLRRKGSKQLLEQTITLSSGNVIPSHPSRLKLLELISGNSQNLQEWQKNAISILRLDPNTPWLNNEELFQFFKQEYGKADGERLSDGEGIGLW